MSNLTDENGSISVSDAIKITELENKIQNLQTKIEELENNNGELSEKNNTLQQELDDLKAKLEGLADIETVKTNLENEVNSLKELLTCYSVRSIASHTSAIELPFSQA